MKGVNSVWVSAIRSNYYLLSNSETILRSERYWSHIPNTNYKVSVWHWEYWRNAYYIICHLIYTYSTLKLHHDFNKYLNKTGLYNAGFYFFFTLLCSCRDATRRLLSAHTTNTTHARDVDFCACTCWHCLRKHVVHDLCMNHFVNGIAYLQAKPQNLGYGDSKWKRGYSNEGGGYGR